MLVLGSGSDGGNKHGPGEITLSGSICGMFVDIWIAVSAKYKYSKGPNGWIRDVIVGRS